MVGYGIVYGVEDVLGLTLILLKLTHIKEFMRTMAEILMGLRFLANAEVLQLVQKRSL